ncbi:MAG: CocE/NonD family hydrolase [Chitinophagaceae bacterium]
MKAFFSFALICMVLHAPAQTFYFPKAYYTDSAALRKNISDLAKQVIIAYKETDKITYLENVFRYQLVAGQYEAAIKSLDSQRNLLKDADTVSIKGIGFQFQTYATAKIRQAEKSTSFAQSYTFVFSRMYSMLPEAAAVTASGFFGADIKSMREGLEKILRSQAGKDSLSLEEARVLCRAYNAYNVYSQVIPLAIPLLAELDNKLFFIEDSVLIKTRDGAVVAATVVRKKDVIGKLPVIFVFNIYNSPRDKSVAKEAALKGYVGVVANTRGKRLSPQAIEPFEHDANDAYDIIEWISKQSWSNGKTGMFGGSYLGFSQWAAAKNIHPSLKTIVPQVAVGIGIDYPMTNNVFMSYMLRWIHYVTNSKETDITDFNNSVHWKSVFNQWYVSGKSFRSLDSIDERPSAIFQRWLQHPSYDAYWQKMVAYKNDFSKINIPVLTTTGYYDADQLGALYYFDQHHLYNKNANHFLVIGPYDHGGAQGLPASSLSNYKIDSVANISITNLTYQWFNYILKDSARPALLKDKINYQVMGTNEWKHAPSLGKMNNDTLSFYLSNTSSAQHYKLAGTKLAGAEYIRQEVDFKDRSDSAYSTSGDIIDSIIDVSNGLSFISTPMEKAVEINGSFIGALKASINKKDMDVYIAMYEQMADGKYFSLGTFLTRASYSGDRSKRRLLQPGKVATIPITNSFFTSKKIAAGSKLVVVLSINKTSGWQINYGTGKDVSDETIKDAGTPLEIKWYCNSVIKIPVLR